jgi:hypothetical protein
VWTQCQYKDTVFSPKDPILSAVELFQRSLLKWERLGIQIKEIEGDNEFQTLSDFEVSPSSLDSKMLLVLQLLGKIKERYPTLDMEYQAFENSWVSAAFSTHCSLSSNWLETK